MEGYAKNAGEYMNRALEQNVLRPGLIEHDPFFASVRDDPKLRSTAVQMRERTEEERRKLERDAG